MVINNGYEILNITCTMHDCDNNQHCFRTNKTLQKNGIDKGHCRYCDIDLIDWNRLYQKDITDFNYLKSALQFEMVRNTFWNVLQPTDTMIAFIRKFDSDQLKDKIRKYLVSSLSKPKSKNFYDGRQTPVDENIIHWAQHATGTCCRVCLDQWHGIDVEETITDDHYTYLSDVVFNYIKAKINIQ